MQLGVVIPQTEMPDPGDVVRLARTADAAGFSFLLLYDHVLGADRRDRPDYQGPYDVGDPFHEPFVMLGHLAAHTALELWTGVLVLPQRQTALVAKQAAQVDLLSGGRLRLGVGVGWNPVEYEALGVDFGRRGDICEEQVELLRALWTEPVVDFTGRFHRVDRAGLLPMPVQRPIPIWMGGTPVPRVLDRIGRLADGWIAMNPPGYGLEEAWARIQAAAAAAGRPPGAVGLMGLLQPGERAEPDRLRRMAERWRQAGATHVAVSGLGAGRGVQEHVDFLRSAAEVLRR